MHRKQCTIHHFVLAAVLLSWNVAGAEADDGSRPTVFLQSEYEIHFIPPANDDGRDVEQKATFYKIDSKNKQAVFENLKEQIGDRPILISSDPDVPYSRLKEIVALFADEEYDIRVQGLAEEEANADSADLRRALQKQLGELFDQRQKQQLKEVERQMEKLRLLNQRIIERASRKDAIIAERLEAILAGDDFLKESAHEAQPSSTNAQLSALDREMAEQMLAEARIHLQEMLSANERVPGVYSDLEVRRAESKVKQAQIALRRLELTEPTVIQPDEEMAAKIRQNEVAVAKLNLERAHKKLEVLTAAGGVPGLDRHEAEYQVQLAKLNLQKAEILAETSSNAEPQSLHRGFDRRVFEEFRALNAEYQRNAEDLEGLREQLIDFANQDDPNANDSERSLLRSQYHEQQKVLADIRKRIDDMKAQYEISLARRQEESTQLHDDLRLLENEREQAQVLVEQNEKLLEICKTQFESGTGSQSNLIEAETEAKLARLKLENIQAQIELLRRGGNRPAPTKSEDDLFRQDDGRAEENLR